MPPSFFRLTYPRSAASRNAVMRRCSFDGGVTGTTSPSTHSACVPSSTVSRNSSYVIPVGYCTAEIVITASLSCHALPHRRSRCSRPQPRVERVAQAVAEEVEGDHRHHDGEAGEGRDPPGVHQRVAAVAHHVP